MAGLGIGAGSLHVRPEALSWAGLDLVEVWGAALPQFPAASEAGPEGKLADHSPLLSPGHLSHWGRSSALCDLPSGLFSVLTMETEGDLWILI